MSLNLDELAPAFIREVIPYKPGKSIDELKREYGLETIIKLASNESPLPPSQKVKVAIEQAAHDVARYPEDAAPVLRERLAKKDGVKPEQIVIGAGSSENLGMLIRCFVSEGDEVVVSEHAFSVYRIFGKMSGASIIQTAAKHYGHDLEAMLAAVTEKTKIVFIANPNNPTGTWLTFNEIQNFLKEVPENVLVVLDEAYYEYVEDENYQSAISLLDQHTNLVITRTFSKAYGLGSLRVGYSISSSDLVNYMMRVRYSFNCNSIAVAAALAALEDKDYLEKNLANNHQGLIYLKSCFDKLGLEYVPSATNFILVKVGERAMDVFNALLKEGVIVRPTVADGLADFLRVSVGLPEENQLFITKFEKVLKEIL
ncbi:histidinol-phosphate transaminase [Piscirickettsia litoralis]|uniref:Histidinol-phosphate aminotransferase n=2 Tax=Piscirickettsia litoralis TaxID=1891921 RepID=A0ABX3A9F2_9GAMM|nr:histidinol-phosphate transaminase [Piscirickettsia litoralis]